MLAGVVLLFGAVLALGRGPADLATIPVAALPVEARETLVLIQAGGPFPFAKDGSVFRNRERALPRHPHGFYREYTVPTPASRNRGARRIITGGVREFYWTADHYRSFQRIEGVP